MATRKIAFYGHNGVGTTTVVVNVAAALAEAGLRVIVVGCDGELHSTTVLHPRSRVVALSEPGQKEGVKGVRYVVSGFKGIRSIELGRIYSQEAFAGAIGRLHELLAIEGQSADLILFDISGDVQFNLIPLAREGFFDEVVSVASAQPAALKSINRLLRFRTLGFLPLSVRLIGLIGNALPTTYSSAILEDFSRKTTQAVIAYIPRSLVVLRCEFFGETLIDAAPLSHHSYLYRKLAKTLQTELPDLPPVPLSNDDFEDWSRSWGDRLYDLGEGLVEVGSGI